MNFSEFDSLLSSFSPIGLQEMDCVSLMNRTETKYVFSTGKIPVLLDHLYKRYKILEIEKNRCFGYESIYYDTPEYLFYYQQVRGKLNRYKLRYRRYVSTGSSFLEIKKKTNKNRTIKWRIANSQQANSFDTDATGFIRDYLPYNGLELKPVLINGFKRITMVCIESKERITLDYDLSFISTGGTRKELPFLSVMEIKSDRHPVRTQVGDLLKNKGIKPNGFSKYCIGNILTNEMPGKNSLKPDLLLINKIENEHT